MLTAGLGHCGQCFSILLPKRVMNNFGCNLVLLLLFIVIGAKALLRLLQRLSVTNKAR